jgi:hypothetical protein
MDGLRKFTFIHDIQGRGGARTHLVGPHARKGRVDRGAPKARPQELRPKPLNCGVRRERRAGRGRERLERARRVAPRGGERVPHARLREPAGGGGGRGWRRRRGCGVLGARVGGRSRSGGGRGHTSSAGGRWGGGLATFAHKRLMGGVGLGCGRSRAMGGTEEVGARRALPLLRTVGEAVGEWVGRTPGRRAAPPAPRRPSAPARRQRPAPAALPPLLPCRRRQGPAPTAGTRAGP